MYYKTYQYSRCDGNKTLELLNEMYVFPIDINNYDNKYVKYTSLSSNVLLHSVKLWYNNYDIHYPTHDSLQLLYTKTIEILNNN